MLLNNLSQNFCIYFQPNTFYPEVCNLWMPQIKRMFLPYVTLEDFFNAQITALSFPSVLSATVTQRNQNYPIYKRPGLQLDQQMNKTLTITTKITESYMTYFIARQQFDLYLKFGEKAQQLYMPPVCVTILDDGGFETISYCYNELTPINISDFDLSYSAKPGAFNTFTWEFQYNYFDIWYRDPEGKRSKIGTDPNNGMLKDKGLIKMNQFNDDIRNNAISKENSLKNVKQTNGVYKNQTSSNVTADKSSKHMSINVSRRFASINRSNNNL